MRASSPRIIAVVLAALGHLDAEQLLDGQREAHVVEHRRDVVAAIDVGEDLRPGAAFAHLLEAAVQVPDLHVAALDGLARQLEHDADGAVHGRMRRSHVEQHGLGGELDLALVEVSIERLHQSSPPGDEVGLTTEAHALVAVEGRQLLDVVHLAVGHERLDAIGRVVLAQRVPDELRIGQDPSQIRVILEDDAEHVASLALEPVGGRPELRERVDLAPARPRRRRRGP